MPLGAARIAFLAKTQAVAEVSRVAVDITANGGAQISTTQSKFGGASFYNPGAEGDYIQASPREYNVGTGDFTVEGWFYTSDTSQNGLLFNNRIGALAPPAGSNFIRLLNSKLQWSNGTTSYSSTTNPANNTWYHYAIVRENGNMSMYLNGTRENTWSFTGNLIGNRYISMGEFENGIGSATYNGYIDEVRFSNVARYSGASHTVPTEPFQNDENTLLLLHMDGTDGSTVFTDDNGV